MCTPCIITRSMRGSFFLSNQMKLFVAVALLVVGCCRGFVVLPSSSSASAALRVAPPSCWTSSCSRVAPGTHSKQPNPVRIQNGGHPVWEVQTGLRVYVILHFAQGLPLPFNHVGLLLHSSASTRCRWKQHMNTLTILDFWVHK